MKQGQETNQIWTQEAGTHDTHDRGLTLLPPPGRRVPRRNSSTGEGGWALWRPLRTNTDRNTGRGPPERNRQRRPRRIWELWKPWRCRELRWPWRCWELWRPWRCRELRRPWRCRELRRPWQVVFGALASVPSAQPLQPELILPPQKISLGKWGGIRIPPWLNRQDSTKQDRNALQGQTDRTGQPTETASTSTTRGQAARMASMATTRGAACPRRVSMDKTRPGKLKCSCGHNKTDTRHSWPWHVDLIHGARDSGGQRAWVSANPVGLSQRQSGGLESAAIRRAWVSGDPAGLSQRRSGGHWVRGGPAGIESEAIRWRDLPRMARLGERQPGN